MPKVTMRKGSKKGGGYKAHGAIKATKSTKYHGAISSKAKSGSY